MSEYILEMRDIVKEFFGVKALDGVTLKVKKEKSMLFVVKMELENPH